MSEHEQTMLKAQQGYEQMGEILSRMIAPLVANYWAELRRLDVPRNVAAMLTEDVQAEFLTLLIHGKPE